MDFASRLDQSELMDTEQVGFEDFRACLRDIARVNRLTFAYRPTLAFLTQLLAQHAHARPLQIVDVGSGYGDMLRVIARWAARRRIAVELTGVDVNPWSERAAREATGAHAPIRWLTADAFSYEPPAGIDVVLSSLFTHHLPDAEIARFLRFMERRARCGWFVNDLHRHPVPYHAFRGLATLARYHRFVRHDGPVSVARAFTRDDWTRALRVAGLAPGQVEVRWWLPFRLTVARIKQSA